MEEEIIWIDATSLNVQIRALQHFILNTGCFTDNSKHHNFDPPVSTK